MQSFVITLRTCSVTMSVVAFAYMDFMPLLAKRYSEKGRYYAWMIVVIGLIIPFRPHFDNAFVKVDVPEEAVLPAIWVGNGMPVYFPAPNTAFSPASQNISWWQAAVGVWLAGVIVFLAYYVIRHYRFLKMTGRWSENIEDERILTLLWDLKTKLGISKEIGLYLCPGVGSPLMVGLVNPRILLPKVTLTQDELGFVLRNELFHYKGKDLWYKYLVLTATAIHWFNPVVHFMERL